MTDVLAIKARLGPDDYQDVKADTITGGADAVAMAVSLHVKESDSSSFRPMTELEIAGLTTATTLVDDGTVTASGSATQFPTAAGRGVIIQADPTNTTDVLIGENTTPHFRMLPGAVLSLSIANLNVLYHKAVSGSPVVNYLVFN